MRTNLFNTILIILFAFSTLQLWAQQKNTDSSAGIFDLLQSEELIEVDVKTDLSYLVTNKKTADEYIDGTFSFQTSKDVTLSLPVKVKCRGRYRRMKCEFPPLKLKFKKDDLAANNLNEFNELKLVTHCIGDKKRSRDLILRECLAYNLFNVLTPNSLRAQLVKVNYLNVKGRPKKIKGWGILIEDSDELAHRLKGEKYQRMGVPIDSFNLLQEQTAALFNYMIGNTDWSRVMARNIELINSNDGIYIVPYDFDFAGMVNAPYAVPNSSIGQKSIKERHYLGEHFENAPAVQEVRQLFIHKKEAIFSTVDQTKMLSSRSKNEVHKYLEEFYQLLESNEKLHTSISKHQGERMGTN